LETKFKMYTTLLWKMPNLLLNCTLNCANKWTQQLNGLYPLRYFFWTWYCQHVLVNTVHIPSHAIKVQHV
jgi:hypothetical protein